MDFIFSRLFIGNALTMIGAIIMVCVGLIKDKKKILLTQNAQFFLMGVGNLVLGSVTAFLSNMISIVRNFLSIKVPFTLPFKLVFSAVQIAFTALINKAGLFGWLPTVAALLLTFSLDAKDALVLKGAIVAGEACWVFHDLYFSNYASFVFDVLTIISTAWSMFSILRTRKKESNETPPVS